jgi:SEC-C motif-containing protein
MRSRYSAYAYHLANYIIATTHPENPRFSRNQQEILQFCQSTQFKGLQILDFQEKEEVATVTFAAYLLQNSKDASFCEKSLFCKVKGRWLYRDALEINSIQ